MSRNSRPPGFDMTYRPKKVSFGPPWLSRLPATVYFVFACLLGLTVIVAPYFPGTSWVYRFFVEADYRRVVSASSFAILIFASGLAAIIRQQLNGIIVHPDGIESREVSFGMPKIRRYAWAQIDRVRIPPANRRQALEAKAKDGLNGEPSTIRLDLWDGSKMWLPPVEKFAELSVMIERVAMARAIPIEGGSGLVDDLSSPFGDEHASDAAA